LVLEKALLLLLLLSLYECVEQLMMCKTSQKQEATFQTVR